MKKTALIILIGVTTFCASAQGKEFELNFGFTTGDFSDEYGFEINLKGGYLWEVSSGFILGPSLGFSSIFSKKDEGAGALNDLITLTISAAGRVDLSETVFLGADLGYGFITTALAAIGGGGKGGLHYRPIIGFKLGERFAIMASYSSIIINEEDFSSLDTFQIGLRYRAFKGFRR